MSRSEIEIEVEQLMKSMKIGALNTGIKAATFRAGMADSSENFDIFQKQAFDRKSEYQLGELLAAHDEQFVLSTFNALLYRLPTDDELTTVLTDMRAGKITKVDVVGRLSNSVEGKAISVPISGLAGSYFLSRVRRAPLIGGLFSCFYWLLRLPKLARGLRVVEQEIERRATQTESLVENGIINVYENIEKKGAKTNAAILSIMNDLEMTEVRIGQLNEDVENRIAQIEENFGNRIAQIEENFGNRIAHIEENFGNRIAQHDLDIQMCVTGLDKLKGFSGLERKIKNLERITSTYNKSTESLVGSVNSGEITINNGSSANGPAPVPYDDRLDAFYVNFEDHFRGNEEEVKRRLSYYLAEVEAVTTKLNAPLLDIGTGRGEWLELLQSKNIEATGVDINHIMVSECQQKGLAVNQGDALEWLASLPENSLAVVSAFHVVEHLTVSNLLALFSEVYRVLVPGGMIVFETPNPENVDVSTLSFYYDPTHVNPVPPELLKYYSKIEGYSKIRVERVNADLLSNPFLELPVNDNVELGVVVDFLSEKFLISPDYALIAYK